MNSTPMAKRSKRAQREHYAAKRRREPAALPPLGSICPAPISPVGAGASLFHMEKHRKGLAKS